LICEGGLGPAKGEAGERNPAIRAKTTMTVKALWRMDSIRVGWHRYVIMKESIYS
jgi:hypothetical protein